MVIGLKTKEQLEAVSNAVRLPLVLGGAGPEIADRDYLGSQRVRLVIRGHQTVAAAYQAVYETMKALRDGVDPADLEGLPLAELTNAVKRNADYERWIDDFLGGRQD